MKDDKLSNMFSLMELLCRPQGCSVREAMKELHCASRTFYRTLNTFDELHIPYDKKPDFDGPTNSQRYFIDQKYQGKFGAKILRLSTAEYFLLKYLLRKDTLLQNTTMMPVVDSMRQKLNSLTFCDTKGSDAAIYISDRHKRNYDRVQQEIFCKIMESLERHVQLSVKYKGAPDINNKRTESEFQLNPYTFLDHNGALYVIGARNESEAPRIFSLDRFSRASIPVPEVYYDIPEGFSPAEYLADTFGIYTGEEPQRVKLLFKWHTWTAIADRTWGKDQNFTRTADGSFLLEFTARGGYELESWIRSFGDGVKVLAPESLRQKIKDSLKAAYEQY